MLPIHTGSTFFTTPLPPPVPMILPWRGAANGSSQHSDPFDEYVRVAPTIFADVPLAEARVGVLPFSWKYTLRDDALRAQAVSFAQLLAAAGKPLLVFFDSDVDDPVDLPNAIVFRTSASRSRARPNEHGLPGWGPDLVRTHLGGTLALRHKSDVPVVGFCGYAPPLAVPLGRAKVKESIRWGLVVSGLHGVLDVPPAYYARVEAIRTCRRTRGIRTNFVLRREPSFVVSADPWGTGRLKEDDAGSPTGFRSDFVENLLESDYVLCTRGYGNYSYRLYEALCCGRIPLFVDTDCLLPFHDEAPWHATTVWVDQADLADLGARVRDVHTGLSPGAFTARQQAARQFWEQWLAPAAFFRRVAARLAA
jgi:hypothetical protein